MFGLSSAIQPCRSGMRTLLRIPVRANSNLPAEAPAVIALQDSDRVDLQKNKAPEEKLDDVKTHTGQV